MKTYISCDDKYEAQKLASLIFIKDGMETFFGLDNANTKIQLVYGLFEGLQIGLGRESLRKTFSGHVKFKLVNQTDNSPVNITGYGTINLNTDPCQ